MSALRRSVRAAVPPLAGWRGFPRACANVLVFALAVLAGEWLVHQTEYLIEYGSRFGTVMNTTPHRLYMASLGLFLGGLCLVGLSSALHTLRRSHRNFLRLSRILPARLFEVIIALWVP